MTKVFDSLKRKKGPTGPKPIGPITSTSSLYSSVRMYAEME